MQNFWTLNGFVKNAVGQKVFKTEMFGVNLQTFMDIQRTYVIFLNIPWVVRLCTDALIQRGLKMEGLFRVPGTQTIIQKICEKFNAGAVPDFGIGGLEEVSGVFKKYIRELPAPLFTCDLPDSPLAAQFSEVINLPTDEQKVDELNRLIKQTSPYRRALIKEIFLLLHLVSLEAQHNFMDSNNLGTIFGSMVNIISSTMFADEKKTLCAFLIDHYPTIFHDIDILLPLPPCELTPEQKTRKTVISVFLDDGTFRTIWAREGDTALQVITLLVAKLAHLSIKDSAYWHLFDVKDREARLIEDDELIPPLILDGRCILFTDKMNLGELRESWHVTLAKKDECDFLAVLKALEDPERDKSLSNIIPEDKPVKVVAAKKGNRRSTATLSPVPAAPPPDPATVTAINGLCVQFCSREEEYRAQLTALISYSAGLKGFMTSEDHVAVFSNLEAINMLHLQMAARLKPDTVFQTISGMTSYFKMYGQIRQNESNASISIKKLLKDEKLKAQIQKHKKDAKITYEFTTLLPLPSKRLQEIEDALQEMLAKIGSSSYPVLSLSHIRKAHADMSGLNVNLNELAETAKSGHILLHLSKELDNLPSGFELMTASRRYISEATGFAKIDSTVIRHPCTFYLFSDIVFIVSKKEAKKKFIGKAKGEKLHLEGHVMLSGEATTSKMTVTDPDFIGEVVVISTGTHSFSLHTDEAKRWAFLISSAINVIKSGKETFSTATTKKNIKTMAQTLPPPKSHTDDDLPKKMPKPKRARSNSSLASFSSPNKKQPAVKTQIVEEVEPEESES